jgi:hypothetical protein
MHYVVVGIIAAISIGTFVFILLNFRRQRDFEGTGRLPPEDYD